MNFHCDLELLPVTLSRELDIDSVIVSQLAKYLGQRSSEQTETRDQLLYLNHKVVSRVGPKLKLIKIIVSRCFVMITNSTIHRVTVT